MDNLNVIMKCVFGSHLYGTSTLSSDKDLKQIFLPSKEEILLGKIHKSYSCNTKSSSASFKNTNEDVDIESYSLHYFIKLALEGQTVAFDMLHVPDSMLLVTSDIWKIMVANREKFYTKNIKAFVGYANNQASKYGLRSGRLGNIIQVIKVLETRLI